MSTLVVDHDRHGERPVSMRYPKIRRDIGGNAPTASIGLVVLHHLLADIAPGHAQAGIRTELPVEPERRPVLRYQRHGPAADRQIGRRERPGRKHPLEERRFGMGVGRLVREVGGRRNWNCCKNAADPSKISSMVAKRSLQLARTTPEIGPNRRWRRPGSQACRVSRCGPVEPPPRMKDGFGANGL